MESRYENERAFHDELVEAHGNVRPADRFYAVNVSSWDFYVQLLLAEAARAPRPPRILEYGSGAESHSATVLAKQGYAVIGIDLSEASVRKARERAGREV